jgi:hypothetical protein
MSLVALVMQNVHRSFIVLFPLPILGARTQAWRRGTHPVKAADAVVDSATSYLIEAIYAATCCGPARFQFQGNSSSQKKRRLPEGRRRF